MTSKLCPVCWGTGKTEIGNVLNYHIEDCRVCGGTGLQSTFDTKDLEARLAELEKAVERLVEIIEKYKVDVEPVAEALSEDDECGL